MFLFLWLNRRRANADILPQQANNILTQRAPPWATCLFLPQRVNSLQRQLNYLPQRENDSLQRQPNHLPQRADDILPQRRFQIARVNYWRFRGNLNRQ